MLTFWRSPRNPRAVERSALQAQSTVLLINIMPALQARHLCLGASESEVARLTAALEPYAVMVEDLAAADFVVVRISNLRDQEMEMISIALEAGVPTIVAIDSTSVTDYSWLIDQDKVVAVLLMTYNGRIDHGTAIQGFDRLVNPKVLAEMLFGRRSPGGRLVYELPRSRLNLMNSGATYL